MNNKHAHARHQMSTVTPGIYSKLSSVKQYNSCCSLTP